VGEFSIGTMGIFASAVTEELPNNSCKDYFTHCG
jgi:hypothetical protein